MLNQAIEKIENEMTQNANKAYIQRIGKFLLNHLKYNPSASEQFMAADKTIAKSVNAMKTEARKNQFEGCGTLTDEEGFEIVLKYFGIQATTTAAPPPPVPEKKAMDFNVRLEDLL